MINAILLASGGLDSFVLAYYLKKKLKKELKLLFFNYGQKPLEEELFCVKRLAKQLNAKLKVIDMTWLGKISTSLIHKRKTRCKGRVIKWYVPFRNPIFISAALAFAESEFISKGKKQNIYLGIKYEGDLSFNDTKPEFLKQINKLAKFTQKGNFKIKAPFINKDKEDIIELADRLGVKLEDTYSCYIGGGFAKINNKKIPIHCGKCAGCKARKKGFRFSYISDASMYKT